MKAYVSALLLLSILVVGVWVGSLLLSRSTSDLCERAEILSEPTEQEVHLVSFQEAWEERRPWYMLTINTGDIGRIDESLAEAMAAHKTNSDSDYAIAVARLQEACSHIHDLVGLRAEQIF